MGKGPEIKVPKNVKFTKNGVKAELVFNTRKFVGDKGSWQDKYSEAQRFIDSEVLRLCEPYTPLLTGTMIKSGTLGTDIGSGEVKWIAPYSRKQYYSPRPAGSKTGPLRGPFWFERMKQVHKAAIVAGAKAIAGRGSK